MYRFYKKVEKSLDNKHGLELFENGNPFEQPTFLSMLALNTKLRDTNGAISRILEFSGIRFPNGEENIPMKDIPINFMSLGYSEAIDDRFPKISPRDNIVKIDEETRSFVLNYMLPLISTNGQKKDIDECLRNMRNINIMCFCNAIYTIKSMSLVLTEEMHKLDFTDEEINNILSQVCIFSIGTEGPSINSVISDIKFSTIFILDIKDSFNISDKNTLRSIFGSNSEICCNTSEAIGIPPEKVCKNSKMILINADGEHELKSFIHKGKAFPTIIIKFTNDVLNNSIINQNTTDIFIPIDVEIDKLEQLCNDYIEDKKESNQEELLDELMQNISYQSVEKLSQGINNKRLL